ncbi:hypothetical protein HDV05_002707, partial [Chytridiales sp. JEL 0842]
VWDVDTLSCLSTLEGHEDGINSIFILDDNTIASASSDRTVKIWNIETQQVLHTLQEPTSEVLDITSGMGMLFSSTYDASIHVYDLRTYDRLTTMRGHNW